MLMCVSALVIALGLSTGAVASAGVSAKPAAKKGKSCKKGKAGKSAAALGKKKGKGKPCKGKGKSEGTATLSDGAYEDAAQSLKLTVSNGTVILQYIPPGFCVAINYTSDSIPFTKSGGTWKASENRSFSLVGEPATVDWDLAVKDQGLEYALNFKLESNTMIGLCKGEGHPKGTLTKVG